MGKRLRALVMLASVSLAMPAAVLHAQDRPDAQRAFDAGTEAFGAGRYDEALEHFIEARRAGMDSASLDYNLGVTYYQLGEYDDAREAFRRLLSDPQVAPKARYNLGLVALARDDQHAAASHFERAYRSAQSPGLKDLARRALLRTGRTPDAPWRTHGVVSLAGGHDDNVTLASEADLVGVSEVTDGFADVLAAARVPLSGSRDDGLRLDAAAYAREYAEVGSFDQRAIRLGLTRVRAFAPWRLLLGGHGNVIYLGGTHFETLATLSTEARRTLSHGDELRLRYRLTRVEAGSRFERLTGWRQRARAEVRWGVGTGRIDAGYELELNDREDRRSGTEFESLSPVRHSLYARGTYPLGERWTLSSRVEYRHSRYRDPNVTATSTGTVEHRREEDQYQVKARAARRVAPRWHLFGEYLHTRNDANLARFAYTRNEIMLGGEWLF